MYLLKENNKEEKKVMAINCKTIQNRKFPYKYEIICIWVSHDLSKAACSKCSRELVHVCTVINCWRTFAVIWCVSVISHNVTIDGDFPLVIISQVKSSSRMQKAYVTWMNVFVFFFNRLPHQRKMRAWLNLVMCWNIQLTKIWLHWQRRGNNGRNQ